MLLKVEDINEPLLEFGQGATGLDPKDGLPQTGPFASDISELEARRIVLGLVCLESEVELVKTWVDRMNRPILSHENNIKRFKEFPGTPNAFRSRFYIPDRFIRTLDSEAYALASSRNDSDRFDALLELFEHQIGSLFGDLRPDTVLVGFPELVANLRIANPRLSFSERQVLERARAEEDSIQRSLFEPSEEEKRTIAELLPQSEELLFRNFHRALKARCMNLPNAVPLQVIRRHTYVSAEAKQSDATRAWNLGLALYYKSGNIPWRPSGLTKETCFVGISFHHLKRRSGDMVYASVANAFTNESEPFVLKGATVPRDQVWGNGKQPYLTKDQAADLMDRIVSEYENRFGSPPARVVVHKTSRYQLEEEKGIRESLLERVSGCELVWMAPTGFRLIRRSSQREPVRGTLCRVAGEKTYLFTTGYVPWWSEYPGPHIPAPLEIGVSGEEGNIAERAREILALTKMNWNSADGIGRYPITIQFARRVGTVMTEIDEEQIPNPLYRFYM